MSAFRLKHLYLRNFRNYKEAEVSFSPTINRIFGENAQGKSNLLEAIHLISTGRSFRTQHLKDLIHEESSFFYLEVEVASADISHLLKLSYNGESRRLQIDANSYATFQPLLGALPSAMHTPSDIKLITGSPRLRRHFLNLHLAQSDPLYVHHLMRYERSLKQRNVLLRKKYSDEIDCWEEEMALSAAYLLQKRREMIDEMQPLFERQASALSQKEELHNISFHSSFPSQVPLYLQLLKKNRARERELGLTLAGPHRDDLSFSVAGRASRPFASEGQKRSAAISLRLAEWQRLSQQFRAKPLMLVDDLSALLDERREERFRTSLNTLGQVFITTPFLKGASEGEHHIHVVKGSLKKVGGSQVSFG